MKSVIVNKGFKHACISGEEIYHIGIKNGTPHVSVVNPLYFDYDKSQVFFKKMDKIPKSINERILVDFGHKRVYPSRIFPHKKSIRNK